MSNPLLETTDLTKSFGALRANDGISFTLETGEVHGIIGPNGSGKTTFFNTVTGFYDPDGGRIVYDGTDITGWSPHRIARRGLGRTFQIPAPFDEMTVRENLLAVHTDVDMATMRERAEETLSLLDIDHIADQPAQAISGGQQKLVELARVLMLDPDLVLLDEPTAGVNPALADRIIDHVLGLNDDGTSFLLIEHDMAVMQDLADVVTVFDSGQIIAEGSFADVTNDDRVMEAYLGSDHDDDAVLDRLDGTPEEGSMQGDTGSRPRLVGSDLTSGYGDHQVVEDISVESRNGVTGIFGPNGSGKSTLLKTLNGLVPAWSGSVTFDGRDVTATPPEELVREGIATLQQDSGVFRSLTVEENLRVGAYHVADDAVVENRFDAVLDTFPELNEKRDDKADTLSGGQRMMVSFGRAMMTGADVYLLDEPSAGLAPSLVDDVFDMVERLVDDGGQVILIEQNVTEALKIVDYVYLLSQGQLRFEGTPADLAEREDMLDVYLGIS